MPDWNLVYNEKNINELTPADVLSKNKHLLPKSGVALDYASGLAANAIFLAENGFNTEAWDASAVAVKKVNAYANENSLKLKATEVDVEKKSPKIKNKFDVIIVSNFLYRENLNDLYVYLKKDGLLFYQTYCGKQIDNKGPYREAFRLQRGELLGVFSSMRLLYYREDSFQPQNKNNQSDIVQFVAVK